MSKFIKKANDANLNLILIGISNHKDFLKILKDKDKDVDTLKDIQRIAIASVTV